MSEDDLPTILISAADATAANAAIKEIIDNEGVTEVGENVWQLSNKYYTARARVLVLGDAEPSPAPARLARLQALVLLLSDQECASTAALERRTDAARGGGAELRLALCGAEPAPGLRAAARQRRLELVPRPASAAAAAAAPGPFPELRGAARLREALHAHVWPGLRTHRLLGPEDEEEEEEEEEEEMERRAELLAGVLGALADARAPGGPGGGGGGGERLLRAEQVVRAFCQALGTDFDDL